MPQESPEIKIIVIILRPNFLLKHKKMKKNLNKWVLSLVMAITLPAVSMAQDKVEASIGADVVSGYIWRGQDLGGASLQPSLTVAYKGLSLTAWGSVGFNDTDSKEFDLILAYEAGNFSISLTDFWCVPSDEDVKYFQYGAHSTAHVFEAQIGYDFGIFALNWYTNIAGADGVNKDGDRAYSSYISMIAPFKLGGLEWEAEIGATPWATDYYTDANGFAVCDISLGTSKEIKVTEEYSLPIFAKATFNPASDKAYLTFGITF